MVGLNGHEAGNGGYSQSKPTACDASPLLGGWLPASQRCLGGFETNLPLRAISSAFLAAVAANSFEKTRGYRRAEITAAAAEISRSVASRSAGVL
jgi:hypothetical protein